MEVIFEALLQFLGELVLEIAGEVIGGIIEYMFSFDFWNVFSHQQPKTGSVSDEIISLNIFNRDRGNL